MAKVLVLSQNRKFKSACSQIKFIWNNIETLDGKETSKNCAPMENYVIQDDKGKITGVTPTGLEEQFTNCTYAHFCAIMRRDFKVAIHDANDFTPVYGIWQGEINELYGMENEENVNDSDENL